MKEVITEPPAQNNLAEKSPASACPHKPTVQELKDRYPDAFTALTLPPAIEYLARRLRDIEDEQPIGITLLDADV